MPYRVTHHSGCQVVQWCRLGLQLAPGWAHVKHTLAMSTGDIVQLLAAQQLKNIPVVIACSHHRSTHPGDRHKQQLLTDILFTCHQETMTPLNQKDILEAARVSVKIIPVHIYLYSHYENPYGYNFTTSKQLGDLVNSLDSRRVKVVGECTDALLLRSLRWLASAAVVVLLPNCICCGSSQPLSQSL